MKIKYTPTQGFKNYVRNKVADENITIIVKPDRNMIDFIIDGTALFALDAKIFRNRNIKIETKLSPKILAPENCKEITMEIIKNKKLIFHY